MAEEKETPEVQIDKKAIEKIVEKAVEKIAGPLVESILEEQVAPAVAEAVKGTVGEAVAKAAKSIVPDVAKSVAEKIIDKSSGELSSKIEERLENLQAVIAIGAAIRDGTKLKPTQKTIEYCAAQGETFVPRTDHTKQHVVAVAPACVVPTNENGKLVIYYQIPDAAHHLFTVPSSVLEYNPPA